MLFNSTLFVIFFIIVYVLYVLLRKSVLAQNILLLVASYVFYGWWDARFLSLILLSTLVDFFVGRALHRANQRPNSPERYRRILLLISIVFNLGLLGTFKYFNFFSANLTNILSGFGLGVNFVTINIILPVGISFYTFQTMSYTIDIYRRKLNATPDLVAFAAFVAFFPQLVAGPIERASSLVPQFVRPRSISAERWNTAIFLLIWGISSRPLLRITRRSSPIRSLTTILPIKV